MRWIVLGLCLLPGIVVRAQTPTSIEAETAAARELQYEELAAEVAELERHGAVLKRVVRLVRPAVVHIEAESDQDTTRRGVVEEAGSGVIIRFLQRTFVITNRHVIKGAKLDKIVIKLSDSRTLHPTRVWADRASDVAVMEVDGRGLITARLGDSDRVEIGDFALAIGSPFRLSHSVTYGIISAKGRRDLELGPGNEGVQLQDFLQTDAAINPGNSGGPLLNLRGEVIGINTAIASNSGGSEGIGFAIPINMAMVIAKQLIERGAVKRAFLGVQLDSAFDAAAAVKAGLQDPRGAKVSGLTARSPAEAAGLIVGDVILEFDGRRVDDDNHLVNLVSLTPVDKDVGLVVFRSGKTVAVSVRVTVRSETDGE